MQPLIIQSASEQVADYLREEILRGKWVETMPGEDRLMAQLGIGRNTIQLALTQLEQKGFLVGQGPGRRRRIVIPKNTPASSLQIAILDYDPPAKNERIQIELLNLLREAGHAPFFTAKTLVELQMDTRRIARLVKETDADAWIICAAPREVIEWFAKLNIPVFGQFGIWLGFPIAGVGPDYVPAVQSAVRRLVELGHHRIVTLVQRGQHAHGYAQTTVAILAEMEKHGIQTGSYNLPSWDGSEEGFQHCLESLFQHTPPSALIIEEPTRFFATLQFCGNRGLRVPQDISLICCELPPSFASGMPAVSHLRWDYHPIVRRIARWADNVARGKEDLRQTFIKAEFIEGGTIGVVP